MRMAVAKGDASIAAWIKQCDSALAGLVDYLQANYKPIEQCNDQLGRFRGWERDVDGKNGQLDYRLRRSPRLHDEVTELLSDLLGVAVNRESSLHAAPASSAEDSAMFGDDSAPASDEESVQSEASLSSATTVARAVSEIEDIVTCLMELKPSLDDPTPYDSIAETFDANAAYYDIGHVKEKFPKAIKEISERLGRANWKRRHYLINLQLLTQTEAASQDRYLNQTAQLRPSNGPSDESSGDDEDFDSSNVSSSWRNSESVRSSYNASQPSLLTSNQHAGTNPTELSSAAYKESEKPGPRVAPLTGHLPIVELSRDLESKSTPLTGANAPTTRKVFGCPYCGLELANYDQDKKWRKHVMSDIEPYMCTFVNCKWSEKTYGSKQDWIGHESGNHRTKRRWLCRPCRKTYKEADEFEEHLMPLHFPADTKIGELKEAISKAEISLPMVLERTECPLCRVQQATPQKLQRHLAVHLEELALFATASARGIEEDPPDFELLEDSDSDLDDAAPSLIESIPKSLLSPLQTARENVKKYFDVMSHYSAQPPVDDADRSNKFATADAEEVEVQFPIFAVIQTANEYFYGRGEELKTIDTVLEIPGKIVSIVGMGGVGKTELAVQYSYQFKDEYDCIFWIQADTDPGLVQSFCQIASTLNLMKGIEDQNQMIELGREWLEHTDKRWLLVFDNLEVWDQLVQYLPRRYSQSTVGGVVITTQHVSIGEKCDKSINLSPFDDEEGGKMLLHYMKRNVPYDVKEMEQAREISNLLGGLPVAIWHVSGYVVQSDGDLEELLELFTERRKASGVAVLEKDDLPAVFRKAAFRFDEALAVVWNITLRELPKDAQDLIYILAFLNSEAVPESLLHTVHQEQILQFLDSREPRRYKRMKAQLLPRRLVQEKRIDEEVCLSVHRSLQRSIRETLMQDPPKAQEVFRQAYTVIRKAFPAPSPIQVPNAKEWMVYQRLLPHVIALRNAYFESKNTIEGTQDFAELLSDAGINQWERGITRDGLLLLRTAEKVLSQLKFDGSDLQQAKIDTMIALMSDNTGISQRAEGLERRGRALTARQKNFKGASVPPSNGEILLYNSYMDYSISLLQYNRYQEAKPMIEKCFEQYQKWGSEEELPFEYSKYHHFIAIVYMYEGEFEKAIRHGERGVDLMGDTQNESLRDRFKFDLACMILQSGDIEKALKEHREVYEARLKTGGKSNELTLHSCYAIGAIYELREQYAQAERWFNEAMNHRHSAYWSKEAIARTQYHLSRTIGAQNKTPDKAQALYNEAKAVLDHMLPLDCPPEIENAEDMSVQFDHLLTVCSAARFTGLEMLKHVGHSASKIEASRE